MSGAEQILVVADRALARRLSAALADSARTIDQAHAVRDALRLLEAWSPQLIIVDAQLSSRDDFEWILGLRGQCPGADLLVLSEQIDVDTFVRSRELGIWGVLEKPPLDSEIEQAVRELFLTRQAREGAIRVEWIEPEPQDRLRIVGRSAAMRRTYDRVAAAARSVSPVLLLGETGTGKELFARVIHEHSRPGKPFEAVNLGGVDATLAASELFGHLRGAFTGADRLHRGTFERAGDGTVFLDEIGDAPPEIQIKLLRVLQERRFAPVGSEKELQLRARVVAATNREPKEMLKAIGFRHDLLQRVRVIEIRVPPLRERREDLKLLVPYLLTRLQAEEGGARPDLLISQEAWAALHDHRWPGNVRELRNCLTRALNNAKGGVIRGKDLELELEIQETRRDDFLSDVADNTRMAAAWGARADSGGLASHSFTTRDGRFMSAREVEVTYMEELLRRAGGNRAEAARLAGIPRGSLYDRLKRLGME